MLFFTQDLISFYGTIYGGIIIGLLFDINKAIKLNFKILDKVSFVFDILFWVLSTIIIFITINTMEFFDLRYYHFIALTVGFLLYYTIISKFVLKILNKLIGIIKSTVIFIIKYITLILESLYYTVIYSIHFLIDILFFIPNIFLSTKKVIRKKYRSK